MGINEIFAFAAGHTTDFIFLASPYILNIFIVISTFFISKFAEQMSTRLRNESNQENPKVLSYATKLTKHVHFQLSFVFSCLTTFLATISLCYLNRQYTYLIITILMFIIIISLWIFSWQNIKPEKRKKLAGLKLLILAIILVQWVLAIKVYISSSPTGAL
jgi:hypothetical protein